MIQTIIQHLGYCNAHNSSIVCWFNSFINATLLVLLRCSAMSCSALCGVFAQEGLNALDRLHLYTDVVGVAGRG